MSIKIIGKPILTGRIRIGSYSSGPSTEWPYDPYWILEPGSLGAFPEGEEINILLEASDENDDIQSFTVIEGSLPPGLTLNPLSGRLTGTLDQATENQRYQFTVQVRDETDRTITGVFEMYVIDTGTNVVWLTPEGMIADQPAGIAFRKKVEAVSI